MTHKIGEREWSFAPKYQLEEVRYERRFVAFYDILGWRQQIDNAASDPKRIARLRNLIAYFSLMAKSLGSKEKTERMSTFSDNVVVSEQQKHHKSYLLLLRLAMVQFGYVSEGCLLRGGFTVGEIVHNNDLVFGLALNRAYELESTIANYPRIVLDPDRMSEFEPLPPCIDREDGVYFLDPFRTEFIEELQRIITLTSGKIVPKDEPSAHMRYFQEMSPLEALSEPCRLSKSSCRSHWGKRNGRRLLGYMTIRQEI